MFVDTHVRFILFQQIVLHCCISDTMSCKLYRPALFHCSFPSCHKVCKSAGGLTQHQATCQFNPENQYQFSPIAHTPSPFPWETQDPVTPPHTPQHQSAPPEVPPTPSNTTPQCSQWETKGRSGVYVWKHPYLDGQYSFSQINFIYLTFSTGIPCNKDGYDLPPNTPPPPPQPKDPDDYFSFLNEELANFFFPHIQMSASNTSLLMDLWGALHQSDNAKPNPPFQNAKDLHDTINSIPLEDIPWEGFKVKYNGKIPAHSPSWMTKEYEVWYQNPLDVMESQIGNSDFAHEIDYVLQILFFSDTCWPCFLLLIFIYDPHAPSSRLTCLYTCTYLLFTLCFTCVCLKANTSSLLI